LAQEFINLEKELSVRFAMTLRSLAKRTLNKNLNQTANTVAFLAKETQKTAPARRWLGWRYTFREASA